VDPLELSTATAAWWTFYATVTGIGIATVAAGIALWDLLRNTAQFRDFTRRPDLQPTFWTEFRRSAAGNEGQTNAIFGINIANTGERLTRGFWFELLLPTRMYPSPTVGKSPDVRPVGNVPYMVYQGQHLHTVFPNGMKVLLGNYAPIIRSDCGAFEALWRIYDDFGNYPKSGYGKLNIEPKLAD